MLKLISEVNDEEEKKLGKKLERQVKYQEQEREREREIERDRERERDGKKKNGRPQKMYGILYLSSLLSNFTYDQIKLSLSF